MGRRFAGRSGEEMMTAMAAAEEEEEEEGSPEDSRSAVSSDPHLRRLAGLHAAANRTGAHIDNHPSSSYLWEHTAGQSLLHHDPAPLRMCVTSNVPHPSEG